MKQTHFRKALSLLLSCAILVAAVPIVASAAADVRIVDTNTMNGWEQYYGPDTDSSRAGGVWLDKTVLKDASAFPTAAGITMKDPDENFLVALSAIASNKTVVGYSSIPTDTMLILDVSGSMSNDEIRAMVTATNAAFKELYALNNYNRVGVVLYSGNSYFGASQANTAQVLLPLDRYTPADQDGTILETGTERVDNNGDYETVISIQIKLGVKDGKGNAVAVTEKPVVGATYMQAGLLLAWQEFSKMENDTVIGGTGFQSGTKRKPVVVLMSDGQPTTATSNYTTLGTSNAGNGSGSPDSLLFLTQLSAAYLRSKIASLYDNNPMFYTLGLNVTDSTSNAVLHPVRSSDDVVELWNDLQTSATGSITISVPRTGSGSNNGTKQVTVSLDDTVKDTDLTDANSPMLYVDEYFPATNANGLITAFGSIVNEIILQSRYYATLVEGGSHDFDGYITFGDELGEFMEVKDIKGILLDETLFTGEMLTSRLNNSADGLGTPDRPTEFGKQFMAAVQTRLGISAAEASALIDSAYNAGQLYHDNNGFSNYIAWYANADGEYLGFCSELPDDRVPYDANDPAKCAVYINRSYGFLGQADGNIKDSDMMFMSIQVHTEIASGNQAVIWKIPASLLPMITYKIQLEGDSFETATNITMTYEAASPVRLVYEVGIRPEVNELTLADIMATAVHKHPDGNGGYYFYSNRWGNGDGSHEISYDDPNAHLTTVSAFEPSLENERFYYTENTTLYRKDGTNYVPVTDLSFDASATYYRPVRVFKNTGSGDNAVISVSYEPVNAFELSQAALDTVSGTVYIKAGTPHQFINDDYIEKAPANTTDTLRYYAYPYVTAPHAGETYTIYHFLGNNGRTSMTPAHGIKLSKVLDAVQPGASDTFRFDIVLTANETLESTYPLTRVSVDGTTTEGTVPVSGDTISVDVKAGETVYITDLPKTATYTVTENTAYNPAYKVSGVTATNGTVSGKTVSGQITPYVLDSIVFTNTPAVTGELIIDKTVVHPFGSAYVIPSNENTLFDVEVTLAGNNVANKAFNLVGGGTVTTDANGVFTLQIRHGQTVAIEGIPADTVYTVRELLPANGGFTQITPVAQLSGTISAAENATAHLVNNYTAAPVAATAVRIEGHKSLVGRDWMDSDAFTFILERVNNDVMTEIDRTTATKASPAFTLDLSKETPFTTIGHYYYRIYEDRSVPIGGIAYDETTRLLRVDVTDADMDGKLEISNVIAVSPATASESSGIFTVDTGAFTNVYRPSGTDTVTVDIQKIVETVSNASVSKAGFSFGLYGEAGGLLATSNVTGEDGVAQLKLSLPATALNGHQSASYTYTVREIVPEEADRIPGIRYSNESHEVIVTIYDKLDGTVYATIRKAGSNEETESVSVSFTNYYEPVFAEAELPVANKTLNGRDLIADEFEFELYLLDDSGKLENATLKQTKKNAVNGTVTFDSLTFDAVGTYSYVLLEKNSGAEKIAYDDTRYAITFTVVNDAASGKLTATREIRKITAEGESTVTAIDFTNTYTPSGVTLTLPDVNKALIGRDLIANEFEFELYLLDDSGKLENATLKQAKKNAADGTVTFDALTFDKVGKYVYVLVEKNNRLDYITYDETLYYVYVDVTYDTISGTFSLAHEIRSVSGGVETTVTAIAFENTYTAPPPPPVAGDNDLSLWLALLFVGGGMLTLSLFPKRKKEVNEQA